MACQIKKDMMLSLWGCEFEKMIQKAVMLVLT